METLNNKRFWTQFSGCVLSVLLNVAVSAVGSEPCPDTNLHIPSGYGVLQLRTVEYHGVYNDTSGNEVAYTTNSYRASENCRSSVVTIQGSQLIITSEYFALEQSDDCMFDYLEIHDDGERTKYCGWEPLTYITSTESSELVFKSDESYEDMGYKIIVKAQEIDESTFCNNTIIGDQYPTKTISNSNLGTNCYYRIESADDRVVKLTLQQLDFGSRSCEEESVVIYEGRTTRGTKMTEICSDTPPTEFSFLAKAFFIEHRNPLNNEQENAFRIKYDFVEDRRVTTTPAPTTPSPVGGDNDCSGRYIDLPDGNLTYMSPYQENNKHCVIVVRNTLLQNHVVQVKFEYFEIEESENCIFDSLRIFSGERKESPEIGGPYCGESLHGRMFVSSGNSLRLEFKTDESLAFRGFKAIITFEPAYDCECDGNRKCVLQGHEKRCLLGRDCRTTNCQNGGTCINLSGEDKCFCKAGFEGDDCSEDAIGGVKHHLKFLKAPRDRRLQEGHAVYPDCELDVAPEVKVQYQWTLNGAPIGFYDSKKGFGIHPGGVLEIENFNEELEGQYACIAETALGVAEHTFQYRLVSECKIEISAGPKPVTKNVGQSALLPCRVNPQHLVTKVTWKKDGIPIDLSDERFKMKSNYYLEITDIELSDKGSYSCHAEDRNGCIISKKGTLTVLNYQPLNKYCGISTWDEDIIQSRLSQGQEARQNENPWHVILRTKETTPRAFCGGTLISRRFVLTAGHCIKEFERKVKIGAFGRDTVTLFLGTTNCKSGGIRREIGTFTVHPSYNSRSTYDNDVALIELDSPVEYGDSVRPICLGERGFIDDTFLEKSSQQNILINFGRVAGCGRKSTRGSQHNKLHFIHLQYVQRETCERTLLNTNQLLTDSMFCAGSPVARTGDACDGDSGGAFIMPTNDRWVQTGIVSWGIGCDKKDHYGVYTHVGVFYDWIKEITKFDEEQVENFLRERD